MSSLHCAQFSKEASSSFLRTHVFQQRPLRASTVLSMEGRTQSDCIFSLARKCFQWIFKVVSKIPNNPLAPCFFLWGVMGAAYIKCSFAPCTCNWTVQMVSDSNPFKDLSTFRFIVVTHCYIHSVHHVAHRCLWSFQINPGYTDRNRIKSKMIKSHQITLKQIYLGSFPAFSCKSSFLLGDNSPEPRWTFSGVRAPHSNQANHCS